MKPILVLDEVTRRFGAHAALSGLSLSLRPGEVYALLGPNGAGKTTTLNVALGFVKPDSGQVTVCGIDAAASPARARECIAYLPEQVAIYPDLSGAENLRYFSLLSGVALSPTDARDLLSDAGLQADAHDRPARGYSKGMRQKVGIAVALARKARLLLLDEPTSGLDPSAAVELSRIIRAAAAGGMAVLMATHDLYRIKEAAQRVGMLAAGRIACEIDPADLTHEALERAYLERFAR
jgi:ABC-2 type transport system ATP-binding protein